MNLISAIDMFASLFSVFGCLVVWRRYRPHNKCVGLVVFSLCFLTMLVNAANMATWWQYTSGVQLDENFGDYLQILQPALWGMLFYIVVQNSQRLSLEKSRRQMRDLVENMPVILQAFDESGNVLAWNSHAERVTGYSKADAIGNSAVLKKIFADQQYRKQILEECKNHGANYHQKLRPVRCKQRFERHVAWSNIAQQFPIEGWANWCVGIDVTEQVMAQKNLEHMATHDELTGLANRTLLLDRLGYALTSCQRKNTRGALILIDLDHFKMVNDTHGHPVGDQLLREVGDRLLHCIKATDTLARLGGDEFIILLEQVSFPEEVSMVAERLTAKISDKPFYLFGNEISVRFSMGITVFPDDDVRVDELMKNVDLALYAAKESGRNKYHFFSRTLHKKMQWQHQVSEKLRSAIDEKTLFIEYQPQVARASHEVVALEALMRWNASGEIPLSPAAFIPIAEQIGLMPSLGRWVVSSVCEQIAMWNSQNIQAKVAINLSAIQLYQSSFIDSTNAIIKEHGIDPSAIEFEITESAIMRNLDSAVSSMKQLANHGFSLSLDDFGKGYSSLSHLKKFPINKIKIDQAFVRSLVADPVNAAIVRCMVDLGHSVNVKVLAEGVETAEQIKHLDAEGCDYYQGFYFSQPLKATSIGGLLMGQLH